MLAYTLHWRLIVIVHSGKTGNMKSFVLIIIFGLLLISCHQHPRHLSGKIEIIEVFYVNWACDCADFIETKFSKDNPDYETKEEDCIFIEPSNLKMKIPNDFFRENHFNYGLRLTGQFYLDQGVPKHYDRKTPEKLDKAKDMINSNL